MPSKGRANRSFPWDWLFLSIGFFGLVVIAVRLKRISREESANPHAVTAIQQPRHATSDTSKLQMDYSAQVDGSKESSTTTDSENAAKQSRQISENEIRQLLDRLAEASSKPLTDETTAEINQLLASLTARGPDALPSIRDYMVTQPGAGGTEENNNIGSATSRRSLFQVIEQIGSAHAPPVLASILQTTKDPLEVALLSEALERLAPGQYQRESLMAARASLDLAAEALQSAANVAPVFNLLQQIGNADAIVELERNVDRWKYYATITLGELPGGTGLPSLIQMLQTAPAEGKSNRDFAAPMLAQSAVQSQEARQALLAAAYLDQIPLTAWPMVASVLSGERLQVSDPLASANNSEDPGPGVTNYHVENGNQNYLSVTESPERLAAELTPRLALLDELLASATRQSNEVAVQALQIARTALKGFAQPTTQTQEN